MSLNAPTSLVEPGDFDDEAGKCRLLFEYVTCTHDQINNMPRHKNVADRAHVAFQTTTLRQN